jgi:hypothetical protein
MTLTPFDIPAPNADEPRSVVPMFPHRMAQATRDAAARQATRDRLTREARHITIRPTWREDLAELVGDIRAAPLSHAVVAVAGFMVGTFGILALAELAVRL